MTDKWDKCKEQLIDAVKNSDDPPTEEQNRFYDIMVGALIAEGDMMQGFINQIKTIMNEERMYGEYQTVVRIKEVLSNAV